MDQVKIGRFIAEVRKEQNYTQKALAEKLGVSDRTVSKWECGKGMPETSLMMPLCEILKISVNELLSGKRLSMEEFSKKAEENVMNLMETKGSNRRRKMEAFITMLLSVVFLVVILFFSVQPGLVKVAQYMDLPSIITLMLILTVFMSAAGLLMDFFHAFSYVYGKRQALSRMDLERAYEAVQLARKILVYGSIFVAFFYAVVVLASCYTKPEIFGPNLAVLVLSILYAMLCVLLLLPLESRLKLKIAAWKPAETEQAERDAE